MSLAAPLETSVGALLADATTSLQSGGVPQARRDARLLIAASLEVGIESVVGYPERLLSASQLTRAQDMIARRAAREPVSRILGRREFWGLDFQLSSATLDPRPESETVIEAVLERPVSRRTAPHVLDLGTGSGCLLLALLSALPEASGLGVDLEPAALVTAAANAEALGLAGRCRFAVSDWDSAVTGLWDILLCNPPYVTEAQMTQLAPEVAEHDPWGALAGGADGLDAYRRLLPGLPRLLAPGGVAALEIGAGQAAAVGGMALAAGLSTAECRRDLAGIERCLILNETSG